MNLSKEDLVFYLKGTKRIAENALEEWHGSFIKDPHAAFDNCDREFLWAARLKAFNRVLTAIEKSPELTVDQIITYFMRDIMQMSRWPSHSTSKTSNYATQCLLAAYAEMVDKAQGGI